MSTEQELVERAGEIIRSIEENQDPSSWNRLYAEYNTLVDDLCLVRMPPKDTFALLPAELKYRIFTEFCSGTRGGPLLLSQVCKQWLQLTHQNTGLWKDIIIIPTQSNWLKHLERYTRLSGERLLDVTLHFPLAEEDIQKMAKCTDFGRWRSLAVLKGRRSMDHNAANRILLRVSGSSRLLSLLQRDPFPNLRDIKIQINSPNTGAPYLWSNLFERQDDLARISSEFTKSTLLSHLTVNLKFFEMQSLLQALLELPDLVYLKLSAQRHDAGVSTPNETKPIPLHQLRELRMENNGLDLLLAIECPRLEILGASIEYGDIQILRMRLLTFTSLKKLNVNFYRGSSAIPESDSTNARPRPQQLITVTDLSVSYMPHGLDAKWSDNHDEVYGLLQLFPGARGVNIASGMETFDLPRVIQLFPDVKHLVIRQPRKDPSLGPRSTGRFGREPRDIQPRLSVTQSVTDMPSLVSLLVEGRASNAVLRSFSASHLRSLVLTDTDNLSIEIFLAFIERSRALCRLYLESVYLAAPYIEDPPLSLTFEPSTAITSSIQELHLMHDGLPIINRLSLPSVHTLRLTGVLQGTGLQHSMYYFPQREIGLAHILDLPQDPLHNLTKLDLCVSCHLFPIVTGLTDILPRLISLKSISLPRALQETPVLVDVLIDEMLKENGGLCLCPQLTDIQTEDYPQWEALMDLLARRNRTAHDKRNDSSQSPVPVPISILRLPGLPPSPILKRLRAGLAGKFPPRRSKVMGITPAQRCDDCALTGSDCLDPGMEKGAPLRSSCSRHRNGPVRITAYS